MRIYERTQGTKASFQKNGFAVLKQILQGSEAFDIYKKIFINIKQCAHELNCSIYDYLNSVSRWQYPSPILNNIYPLVSTHLQEVAATFINSEVSLSEMNLICKSDCSTSAIPCHQDIAYAEKNLYDFSLWIPLQDIGLEDGVLEFLPGSHLEDIAPAVDFWAPNFIDKFQLSARWQENYISQPVQMGDAIVFDSRIWHRSAEHTSGSNRFALVTRWKLNYNSSKVKIPEKKFSKFGMWTCGDLTKSLLQQGLLYCYQQDMSADLSTYINKWREYLVQETQLPFKVNFLNAEKALQELFILHRAAELHNGGDAQGIIYTNVWHTLLQPLSEWLNTQK
jgi:hypothetical protein